MPPVNPPTFQYIDVPIFNALIPKEGPKAVPFLIDFTAINSFSVDLQNLQARKFIDFVQTVFCHNPGDVPVTFSVDQVGQLLVVPPQTQGYFPILVPNFPKLIISSPGGAANVGVFLLNVPVFGNAWPINQYYPSFSGGAMVVSDPILDGTVSGNLQQNQNWITADDDDAHPRFIADRMEARSKNTGAALTIFTPTVGSRFFISHLNVWITGTATFAGAPGTLIFRVRDGAGGGSIAFALIDLPFAAGTPNVQLLNLPNLNFLSSAINNVVEIDIQTFPAGVVTNLTAGNIYLSMGVGSTQEAR